MDGHRPPRPATPDATSVTDVAEVAVAVVTDDDDRVLLVRRRVPEAGIEWQFPAGKIMPGELVRDATVRETAEETGVRAGPQVRLGERTHPATGQMLAYVACRALDSHARAASPREVSEVVWVPVEQLDTYLPAGVYGPVRDYLTGLPALRQRQQRANTAATDAVHAYHAGWRPNHADIQAGDEVLAALGRYVDLTGELPLGDPLDVDTDALALLVLDPDEIRATVQTAFIAALHRRLSPPWRALFEAAHQIEPQPFRPGLWRETAHAILTSDIEH